MGRLLRAGMLTALIVGLFGLIGLARAHPVEIDSNNTEWESVSSQPPNKDNVGFIARNSAGQGQFFWRDAKGDHRIVQTTTITEVVEVDMTQVRVTGDAENLSFFIQLSGVSNVNHTRQSPAPADLPQVQIAIDRAPGGETTLVSPASSSVTIAAPWEYLIRTDFAGEASTPTLTNGLTANKAAPLVYSDASTREVIGDAIISDVSNVVEIKVPWSAIGGFPTEALRFTVVTLRTSGATPADGVASNILDTISPSYPPGDTTDVTNTLAELQDNDIDYSFSVHFEQDPPVSSQAAGDVYSPLLVTEVGLYPATSDAATDGSSILQWIEITNVSETALTAAQVSSYKVGDAPQRVSNEAMRHLPSVALAPGESLIIARNKASFTGVYTGVDASKVYDASGLTPYANWGSTTADLSLTATAPDGGTISDQVVLLDESDTIVDMVEYGSGTLTSPYPNHGTVLVPFVPGVDGSGNPRIQLAKDTSIQRCLITRDTNNNDPANPDWLVTTSKAEETPLAGCQVADVSVTVSGPQSIVVNPSTAVQQEYVINYFNAALEASDVVITDMLPSGMQYVAGSTQSTPAGVGEPAVSMVGGRVRLVWNVGTVAAGGSGQISFRTSVPANTSGSSSHDAAISTTTDELTPALANNTFSLPVTYSTEPVVDVSVSKSLVTTGANPSRLYPGGQVVYRIVFSNIGTKEASGVTLLHTLPAGLTYLSNSRNFMADAAVPGNIRLTVPTPLAPGASETVDLVFAINPGLSAGSTIPATTVTISSVTTPEINAANNTATTPALTLGEPPTALELADLAVSVEVKDDSNAVPGGYIVYTVTYANNGQGDAFDVTLVNSFSSSLEYESNSQQWPATNTAPNQVTLSLPPVQSGASGSVDITFRVKADVEPGTVVTNEVLIATGSAESRLDNNVVSAPETTISEPLFRVYFPVTYNGK